MPRKKTVHAAAAIAAEVLKTVVGLSSVPGMFLPQPIAMPNEVTRTGLMFIASSSFEQGRGNLCPSSFGRTLVMAVGTAPLTPVLPI